MNMKSMHNEKTTARQNWIDGLKGIGIALVILGHAARHDMMADSDLCGIWVYFALSEREKRNYRHHL